jgi:SPP1 gp7 family putative phage head morphogenesis protein
MTELTKGFGFKEAVSYANQRNVVLPDEYYGKLVGVQRSQAVSIAGQSSLEQIKYIIDQVAKVIDKGGTFKDFQKAVRAGGIDISLPQYRLDNIFRTNIQAAYSRGRHEQQMKVVSTRPYWMYDAINDSRTRPTHLALDNTILRYDHPFWQTHYTPNGYRCRCTIISLTEAQAKKRGITTTPPDAAPDDGWDYNVGVDYSGPIDRLVMGTPAEAPSLMSKKVERRLDELFSVNDPAMLKVLRKRADKVKAGMDPRTYQLIVAYTQGAYKDLNTFLRFGDPAEIEALLEAMDGIRDNALESSGAKKGQLWRGARISVGAIQKLKDDYKPGTVLSSPSFLSTTRDEGQALRFAGGRPTDTEKPLFYKIDYKGKGGVDVGELSDHDEVLFFPDKEQFEVTKVTETNVGVFVWLKPTGKAATSTFKY